MRSRKAIVSDAATFVAAAGEMSNVTVTELLHTELEERNSSLDLKTVFEDAQRIPGITRMHCLEGVQDQVSAFVLTKDTCNNTARSSTSDTSANVESDVSDVRVGDWYAVEYEEKLYPGEVLAIGNQNDYQVSVMEQAGKYWKWPKQRDNIFYIKENLKNKLEAPQVVNNHGHFKFCEGL